MAEFYGKGKRGYTVVELMATVVIVAVLAASVGVFFVKLLTIREREREEAYVREKLSDICGAYADFMSIGSSFYSATNQFGRETIVKYRQETGGVSFETGVVTRVAYVSSSLNITNMTMDLGVYSQEPAGLNRKLSRTMRGDALMIPLAGDIISCSITPLNANVWDEEGAEKSDAALGYLQVSARYEVENDDGEIESRTATAGRVVRLWNRE